MTENYNLPSSVLYHGYSLPENCAKIVSAFTHIVYGLSASLIVEIIYEFGKVPDEVLKERIKKLSGKLKEDPNSIAVLIKSFARRINKLNNCLELESILNHLEFDEINDERICFKYCQMMKK